MYVNEVNSFLCKFNELLRAGYDAHLDLNAHAGNSWIGLRVNLGKQPYHPQPFRKKRLSPSQLRRRERRAAFREDEGRQAGSATVENNSDILLNEDSAENIAGEVETVAVNVNVNVEDSEQAVNSVDENVVDDVTEADTVVEITTADNHDIPGENNADVASSENSGDGGNTAAASSITNGVEEPMAYERTSPALNDQVNVVPEVVVIHGTAIIEDSPYETFSTDELDSMVRFITSKEHLRSNIQNIEYTHVSSREFRNNRFKHIVALKIFVKTPALWETPRSYIWRHIGNDTWTRGNGSSINIVKIHQKFD